MLPYTSQLPHRSIHGRDVVRQYTYMLSYTSQLHHRSIHGRDVVRHILICCHIPLNYITVVFMVEM